MRGPGAAGWHRRRAGPRGGLGGSRGGLLVVSSEFAGTVNQVAAAWRVRASGPRRRGSGWPASGAEADVTLLKGVLPVGERGSSGMPGGHAGAGCSLASPPLTPRALPGAPGASHNQTITGSRGLPFESSGLLGDGSQPRAVCWLKEFAVHSHSL